MSWRARWHETSGIELMAVQLQEAKDLLARDTVAHARLAFILLDNAVEVMMFRDIEVLLDWNPWYEDLLKEWEEILQGNDDAEAQAHRDEVAAMVVSKSKLDKLENSFHAKVNFLVEKGHLAAIEGRVVKKFHEYRNELYHSDHIRAFTVHTASLLYFELVCSLFERGEKPRIRPLREIVSPAMERYRAPGDEGLMPSPAMVVAHLRQGLGLNAANLKETLLTHLISRLDEMEADIAWVTERLPAYGPDAVIRLAQLSSESSKRRTYGVPDLGRWRQAVDKMRVCDDKMALLRHSLTSRTTSNDWKSSSTTSWRTSRVIQPVV